jgi:hypothetical protein
LPQLAGPPSPVEDCAASGPTIGGEERTSTRLPDGTLQLQARSDSACVWIPIESAISSAGYHIQFDYRTARGLPARACLWQIGVNRCASLPPLETSTTWHTYDVTARPERSARGLRLYFYADGSASDTITEYRDVRVTPSDDRTVTLQLAGAPQVVSPKASYSRDSPGGYDVEVPEATAPFVIVLNESFSTGWRIKGLPSGVTAVQFVANGYANGWRIDPGNRSQPLHLTLTYAPQAMSNLAWSASAVALPFACLGGLLRRPLRCASALRRRSHRRTRKGSVA